MIRPTRITNLEKCVDIEMKYSKKLQENLIPVQSWTWTIKVPEKSPGRKVLKKLLEEKKYQTTSKNKRSRLSPGIKFQMVKIFKKTTSTIKTKFVLCFWSFCR